MKIELKENMWVRITDDKGGFIEEQSVVACLLFAIWEEINDSIRVNCHVAGTEK